MMKKAAKKWNFDPRLGLTIQNQHRQFPRHQPAQAGWVLHAGDDPAVSGMAPGGDAARGFGAFGTDRVGFAEPEIR